MPDNDKLREIREQIDSLDEQIQRLINERAACAQQVASIKLETDPQDTTFYRPEREAVVLRLSLIHISEPTRPPSTSRMPSSA